MPDLPCRIKAWYDLRTGDNETFSGINLPYDVAGEGQTTPHLDGVALNATVGPTTFSQLAYNEITGEVYVPTADGYSKCDPVTSVMWQGHTSN
jgi:hypothetical protein